MNIIFWQNCLSPHQIPYIKELVRDQRINRIILIAPVRVLSEREKMGWHNYSTLDGIEIIIAPTVSEIKRIFFENQDSSIHLFSGIRADRLVYEYFKISLKYDVKRGLITESPFVFKARMLLHKIRFLLYDYKYVSKIDYVFAMGNTAEDYYNFWSKKWRVFLFGYCVDVIPNDLPALQSNKMRFVYVGSLTKRKNVSLLLSSIAHLSSKCDYHLDIIGNGEEHCNLLDFVTKNNLTEHVTFHGTFSMSDIHAKLINYDVLILPSIHDGWGAVINEGLQNGLYIISSDACGAITLIENSDRGVVFKNKDLNSLLEALNYYIKNSKEIKSGRNARLEWSKKINGEAISKYMIDCLHNNTLVMPPWKKNS
ncbi:glycosyltransferase family 4 protein [Flavobacterium sp. LB2P74]|uniref:glycosyltransferase family 4 protein n=1 Tax=Flavobacterium sp. LB2P74 TaxID=3401717 RepID=UPI003AAB4D25